MFLCLNAHILHQCYTNQAVLQMLYETTRGQGALIYACAHYLSFGSIERDLTPFFKNVWGRKGCGSRLRFAEFLRCKFALRRTWAQFKVRYWHTEYCERFCPPSKVFRMIETSIFVLRWVMGIIAMLIFCLLFKTYLFTIFIQQTFFVQVAPHSVI